MIHIDTIYAGTARGGTSSAAEHFGCAHESFGRADFNFSAMRDRTSRNLSTGMIWQASPGTYYVGQGKQRKHVVCENMTQLRRHPFDQVKALACRTGLRDHNYVDEVREVLPHCLSRDDWAALLLLKRTYWLLSTATDFIFIEDLPVWKNKELRPYALQLNPMLTESLATLARMLGYGNRERP